jgi:hypothetical protein
MTTPMGKWSSMAWYMPMASLATKEGEKRPPGLMQNLYIRQTEEARLCIVRRDLGDA